MSGFSVQAGSTRCELSHPAGLSNKKRRLKGRLRQINAVTKKATGGETEETLWTRFGIRYFRSRDCADNLCASERERARFAIVSTPFYEAFSLSI